MKKPSLKLIVLGSLFVGIAAGGCAGIVGGYVYQREMVMKPYAIAYGCAEYPRDNVKFTWVSLEDRQSRATQELKRLASVLPKGAAN